MNKTIVFFGIIVLSLLAVACTYEGDKIVKIQELPDNEVYEIDGHYVDLGIAFKQDGINLGFDLPYHNYGEPKYVLFYKSKWSDQYDWHTYPLDYEDVQFFVDTYGIPETPKLPFWTRIGEIIGIIIAAICVIAGLILIITKWVSKIRSWF